MLLNKLFATLWKCWRIRCRHYMITIFVIFIPILLYGLLAWGRAEIGHISRQYINDTTYVAPMSEDDLNMHYKVTSRTYLLYAPATDFTNELMRDVQLMMEIRNDKTNFFSSDVELLAYYNSINMTDHAVYAVVFDSSVTDAVPNTLNYSIRNYEKYMYWQTDLKFNSMSSNYAPGRGSGEYFRSAFINLQLAIDEKYIEMKTDKLSNFEFTTQEFPYPAHIDDTQFREVFMVLLPLVTLFSTVFIFPGTLKRMMEEKESGIKELTKMMGLPPSVMYMGWFLDALCPVIVSAVVCTWMMKTDWDEAAFAPIEYCDALLYGIFLLLYFSSCVAFCLFVASLCDSPSLTTSMSILVWIVTYIIPSSMNNIQDLGFALNLILFLIPNFAMYAGFNTISMYETRGNGVQWSNLYSAATGNLNAVPMGYVLLMLFVDVILLLVVGLYFDQIRPGKYGLPKPWYYPIQYLFGGRLRKFKRRNSLNDNNSDTATEAMIERSAAIAGIAINNLTKCYGDKLAVDNMSVRFFEGEIAVLLGRNGAGKTTTMSVLTGMISATRGEVLINDYDIGENLDYVRSVMGICPQHDLLFPELTVYEHVMFFAKLHNIHDAKKKINDLLKSLNIFDKRYLMPQQISGGMKRKLCLAMAIITKPALLILDEPTSGLDPKSRRELWDLILQWRSANPRATIMVSTHFMEEADVLGDRITIMERGRLVAQGTPMYLKKRFANECHLTLILNDGVSPSTLYRDTKNILGEGNYRRVERENSYTIVMLKNDKELLIRLLKRIEKSDYVKHVGISFPSIEDVFLKLSLGDDQLLRSTETLSNGNSHTVDIIASINTTSSSKRLTKSVYNCFYRFGGGIGPRLKNYLPYFLMALAMILLLCFSGNTTSVSRDTRPELQLQLSAYGKTLVYYSADPNVDKVIIQEFKRLVTEQGSYPLRVGSVSDALIELGTRNLDDYTQKAVVGMEFNATSNDGVLVNMMYSNSALHGAPIVLNLAMNVLAKALTGSTIGTSNMPLRSNEDRAIDEIASEIEIVLLWVILMPIALLFLVTAYIALPLSERVANFKHLIYMTGVKSPQYWSNMFAFHYIVLYLPAMLILWGIIQSNELYRAGAAPLLIWLMLYGGMMVLFVFLFSYKKSVASAVGSLTIVTIFTGQVCPFVIIILRNCGETSYERLGEAFHVLALASPQYWLANSLISFTRKSVWLYKWSEIKAPQKDIMCKVNYNPCCADETTDACIAYKSFYQDGMDWRYVLVAFGMMALYLAVLCIADSFRVRRLAAHVCTDNLINLISGGKHPKINNEPSFKASALKKRFNDKEVVENLSFSVKRGECYGLLGVNGAGKTTTFAMITGHEVPTSGTATIKWSRAGNSDNSANLQDDVYFQKLGYCPQNNALNDALTARQLLTLFAEYRGVQKTGRANRVSTMLDKVGLRLFSEVPCGTLSGGNKRKLCLGIALIGNTAVTFLDEPTTGMDPVSRRMVWDVLSEVKAKADRPMVLTSHSMDECEKLCNEIAIMKKGKVEIHGSINELKLQYGQGLNIKIKLRLRNNDDDVNEVDGAGISGPSSGSDNYEMMIVDTMASQADGKIVLKDQHESFLHYFIPKMKCTAEQLKCRGECVGKCRVGNLRSLLIAMERLKRVNPAIEDYTIATSTLEDVFLSVARDEEVGAPN